MRGEVDLTLVTRMSECSLSEALEVWNAGFNGYFADMTFTLDQFIKRFANDGLSPELSMIAWEAGRPVGCVLNGVRNISGKRIAWNGGTAVVPEYRREGIGQRMMQACLDVYRELKVDLAYLEALVQNAPAIRLYEESGYKVVKNAILLVRNTACSGGPFQSEFESLGTVKSGLPHEVMTLPFYQRFSTWQTQWQSLVGGESLILLDEEKTPVAYALYKRTPDESGNTKSIVLYQCETIPTLRDKSAAVRQLLHEVYVHQGLDCMQMAVNIPVSNREVVQILRDEGFTTSAEQVCMIRQMER